MTFHSDEEYFRAVGKYLGYPSCCTNDFLSRMEVFKATGRFVKVSGRPLNGTGFVPCPTCAATYTDEELTAKIQAARVCPVPFPRIEAKDVRKLMESTPSASAPGVS